MSKLSKELDRYLTVRRSLGFELRTDERILRRFIAFVKQQGASHISADLFLRWQTSFGKASRPTWARRLGIIRLFAQWMHGLDPQHEVPSQSLASGHYRRNRPYIYSEQEIRRIVEAAADLLSPNGLRCLTYPVLFGLIAVTGMRISEAIALAADDVDLENGVLTIQRGKLGKSRILPLSASTTMRLTAYAAERDRILGSRPESFFVSEHGVRLTDCSARYNFAVVCQNIGLRPAQKYNRHGRGPRVHDLRHSFAVRTLINWYRTSKDPSREMLRLTTYMGHTNPANTYWYIEAVPELLELASARAATSLEKEAQP